MKALLVALALAGCALVPPSHPCSLKNPETERFLAACEACGDEACLAACDREWARRCEQ